MRNKLARFRQNLERRNVVEPGKPIFETIRGNWSSFFGNERPITFELGCGKGAYTVGLARLYPEQNFVGVDVPDDAETVENLQRTLGPADGAAARRDAVVVVEDDAGEAAQGAVDGRGEADRAGADDEDVGACGAAAGEFGRGAVGEGGEGFGHGRYPCNAFHIAWSRSAVQMRGWSMPSASYAAASRARSR